MLQTAYLQICGIMAQTPGEGQERAGDEPRSWPLTKPLGAEAQVREAMAGEMKGRTVGGAGKGPRWMAGISAAT